jgi:hypothetical protein
MDQENPERIPPIRKGFIYSALQNIAVVEKLAAKTGTKTAH